MFIGVANIQFEVCLPDNGSEYSVDSRFSPFLTKLKDPLYHIQVKNEQYDEKVLSHAECIFDPDAVWKVYTARDQFVAFFTYFRMNCKAPDHCILRFSPNYNQVVFSEKKHTDQTSLFYLVASEFLFRSTFIITKGIEIHGSLLDIQGLGVGIVGHSGEGKSTISHVLQQEKNTVLLNEDRLAARVEKSAMAYGIPWGGSSRSVHNKSVPLSALILLEKTKENSITKLSKKEAMPLILARSFLPYWDESLMIIALDNIDALLNTVPVYLLRCKPEPAIIPLVRSVL